MTVPNAQLHHLAGLYGIRTSYLDMENRVKAASNPALLAVLKTMGAPVETLKDVPSAILEKDRQYWQKILDPVIVVWGNDILTINLRFPVDLINKKVTARLIMENGEQKALDWRTEESSIIHAAVVDNTQYVSLRLYLPERLPAGYHHLILDSPFQPTSSLVISSPLKVYSPPNLDQKIWGVFLPMYALHSQRSWGAGDFTDMESLLSWIVGLGGHLVGTLPLLPSFFDDQFGPGPYMPASRLFWNEFYLDVDNIPELENCPEAQNLLHSTDIKKEIAALHSSSRVDYKHQMSLKRQVLEALSSCFFSRDSGRLAEYRDYIKSNPAAEDYARFRAAGEYYGLDWRNWPDGLCNGNIEADDVSETVTQYYLYSQWLTHQQIESIFKKAHQTDLYIYMDMPVGVHPLSYDVWRDYESFVQGVHGGAPPDPVFTSGQNWNFPPLHPDKIRERGYNYFINCIRHQLKQNGMLRIDHMMGLHRLFWIPEGMENSEGVYVNYRAEELYAILTLESFRNRSIVIGEDLGIVPPEVRPMMEKHGIYRMFVGQYELIAENQLGKVPEQSIASLNTHDMFPFAAFWEETDITERQKLKLIDASIAQKELEQRRQTKRTLISILQYRGLDNEVSQDTQATLQTLLNLLAASPAYAFLINLEDLWLETRPQNVPGTQRKQNWSQKAACSLEQFTQSPLILQTLNEINQLRKGEYTKP